MDSNLQNKLFNYEPTPPTGAWDKIVAALDKEETPLYAQKLYHYQQQPPASAWDAINSHLPNQAPVVPLSKKWSAPVKYISAAAIIAGLVILVTFLVNQPPSTPTQQARKLLQRNNSSNTGTYSVQNSEKPEDVIVTTTAAKPGTTNRSYVASTFSTSYNKLKNLIAPAPAFKPLPVSSTDTDVTIAAIKAPISVDYEELNRYMIFSNKDVAIKVSKKTFGWFDCAYNNQSALCNEHMDLLQEKIAASAVAPSSDFIGMMDILKTLQEN